MPPPSTSSAGLTRTRTLRSHTAEQANAPPCRTAATLSSTASVSTTSSNTRPDSQLSDPSAEQPRPHNAGGHFLTAGAVAHSSSMKLFLGNLRALELDGRSDWPGIDEDAFAGTVSSSQGQKKRVQSVEWALYHLFRLWDPVETRQKLQPFFPPSDQVSSIKLRALLIQCLDTAKKNGVLGRDILLRKTMLDECKGNRLEEVLAAFSAAVLKKVTEERTRGQHPSIAQALALENRGYTGNRSEMAVLMLAYKASLSRQLREKEEARLMYRDLAELLDVKERSLVRRLEQLKVETPMDSISREEKEGVFELVQNNWAGNERWMHTLLHGDEATKRDAFLGTSFDRVWRCLHAGRLSDLEDKQGGGMLDQLDSRIRAQQERLAKWQDLRERMFGSSDFRPTPSKRVSPTTKEPAAASLDLQFTDHVGLSIVAMSPRRKRLNSISTAPPTLVVDPGEYASFLEDFAAEFMSAGRTKQPVPARQTPSWKQKSSPRKSLEAPIISPETRDALENDDAHWPTPSPPARGVSPIQRFFSSLQSSPPVSPPTAALFGADRPDLQPTAKTHTPQLEVPEVESPWEKAVEERPIRVRRGDETPSRRSAFRSVPSPKPSARLSLMEGMKRVSGRSDVSERERKELEEDFLSKKPKMQVKSVALAQKTSAAKVTEFTPEMESLDDRTEKILQSIEDASPSPIKRTKSGRQMTLAERTRRSIMRVTSYDEEVSAGEEEDKQSVPSVTIQEPEPRKEDEPLGYEDLVARTRRSMAGFEAAQKKAQVDRRRSIKLHTSNSKKEKPKFSNVEEAEADYEQSFMELVDGGVQDDYEAVFRSRPKIKTSPAPSPSPNRMGFNM